MQVRLLQWCVSALLAVTLAISFHARAAGSDASPEATEENEAEIETLPDPEDAAILEELRKEVLKPWTGDLDGMLERRRLRVGVTYNRIFYFTDGFRERGLSYELVKALEADINKKLKLKKEKKLYVIFIALARDEAIPALQEGRVDLLAMNMTITPDREALVDFSRPLVEGVREIVIAAPDQPPLTSVEDLSGREVVVRRSSSYYESLVALNEELQAAGKPPVEILLAVENLEDDAIAEMVNVGLYPAMIMDRYKALLWEQVFTDMVVYHDLALRDDGKLAWAMRKDSPQLKARVDAFLEQNRYGKALTNTLVKRYLKSTKFVKNANAEAERQKLDQVVSLFQAYAEQYSFDYLLLVAQGYQESQLDQSVKSAAGAVGIMQVLPATAAGDPINIKDISTPENNIHAGVKYLRFMVGEYFDDPEISELDRHLFAFAAYNAGPNRIARLRKKTADAGLDPNRWFNNVEILVSAEVGRETVDYVANIFKYYIAYKRIEERQHAREEAIEKVQQ